SLDRPVFDLNIGTSTLRERLVEELSPSHISLLCRPYIAAVVSEELEESDSYTIEVNSVSGDTVLFLNGRLLAFADELIDILKELPQGTVLHKNGIAVAALLNGGAIASFFEYLGTFVRDEGVTRLMQEIKKVSQEEISGGENGEDDAIADRIERLSAWASENGVEMKETNAILVSQMWHLITENSKCIEDDFSKSPVTGTAPDTELFKGVDIINEENIIIGSDVEVRSGTVLDASDGPIIILDGARIEPNAILYGPCFIGENVVVRGGAKIGHGTSVGKWCKVGGEIEETIFSAFSNKQHEGFIGHSYISSWVNIGAGSCNSDLKNNYGYVKAWAAGRIKDTGRRFLGVVVGSHSKIAINSRINTGSVIGFNANVMSNSFPPKFVPSFTWQLEPDFVEYDLDSALETAGVMMSRRDIEMSEALVDLFKAILRFSRQSAHSI
ncbi:hypothetical protein DRQ05_05135, partial [bacterium]